MDTVQCLYGGGGKNDGSWYTHAISDVPKQPVRMDEFLIFITEIDLLLRAEHKEDYCGVVYVDEKQDPSYIKIYVPNILGVICGFSDNPPLPGWIMAKIKPLSLDENTFVPANRKRWCQRLFAWVLQHEKQSQIQ